MLNHCHLVQYRDTIEWLNARADGVGGSEIAALMGASKWSSPYKVWATKTGRMFDTKDTEPMEWGRRNEAAILDKFEEDKGRKIQRFPLAIAWSDVHEFTFATLDGFDMHTNAVVEAKTTATSEHWGTGGDWGPDGSSEVPEVYLWQVQHQMMVTGAARAFVPTLFNGNHYRCFMIERDEDAIGEIIRVVAKFRECVKADKEPAIDFADASTLDALRKTRADEGADTYTDDARVDLWIERHGELSGDIKTLKADKDRLEGHIIHAMQGAGKLFTAGGASTTRKRVTVEEAVRKGYEFYRLTINQKD